MPYLTEYGIVIIADSVGQVVITFYFKLQHNRFIKACCFADSSTSKGGGQAAFSKKRRKGPRILR